MIGFLLEIFGLICLIGIAALWFLRDKKTSFLHFDAFGRKWRFGPETNDVEEKK